ncbi:MAG: VacJ family lipoprotein [Limnohabitans sp.]
MKTLRIVWTMSLVLAVAVLQGCATTSGAAVDARDPWENTNRKVYAFNEKLDEAVIRPVAQTYVDVVPSFVRTGVRNFMGNIGDVWTFINAGLQLKGQAAGETFMRVAINTTLGLYGVLDIATEAGIEKRKEDLGQTLGYWGVKPGPYVVLPVLGPASVRDALALPVDWKASPGQYFHDPSSRTGVTLLNVTDTRAGLLKTTDAVKQAALDPYTFVRDAWLQKRENDVYDGNPPADFDYSDPDAP